ncbi:hypothetical protein DKP76_18930, partial [Falsochrobactrum shanghaiense]
MFVKLFLKIKKFLINKYTDVLHQNKFSIFVYKNRQFGLANRSETFILYLFLYYFIFQLPIRCPAQRGRAIVSRHDAH